MLVYKHNYCCKQHYCDHYCHHHQADESMLVVSLWGFIHPKAALADLSAVLGVELDLAGVSFGRTLDEEAALVIGVLLVQ